MSCTVCPAAGPVQKGEECSIHEPFPPRSPNLSLGAGSIAEKSMASAKTIEPRLAIRILFSVGLIISR